MMLSGCNCWRVALLARSRSRRRNELAILVAAPNEIIERMVAAAVTTATKAAGVNAGIGGVSGVAAASFAMMRESRRVVGDVFFVHSSMRLFLLCCVK